MGSDLVLSQKVFHKAARPSPAIVFVEVFKKNACQKPRFFDVLTSDRPCDMIFEPCRRNISMSGEKGRFKLLIMHDQQVPNYKYVIGISAGGKKVMAIMPVTYISHHQYIVSHVRRELGIRMYLVRGGLMVIDDGRIQIFGRSEQYGRANHAEAASILREFLGEGSGFRFIYKQ